MALPDEVAFDLLFPKIMRSSSTEFKVSEMPYRLCFKDICGYQEDCPFCGQSRCGGCPIPLSDDNTVADVLKSLNLESNNTFFTEDRKLQGKEF